MSTFHIPEVALRAYAEDRLADADAWSVEAHLDRCETCRARLPLDEPTGRLVAAVGATLAARLPGQGRIRPGTRWRQVAVLLGAGPAARVGWLGSVVTTLALAVAIEIGSLPVRPWILLLLAPLLPVLGVAVSYGRHTDPLHELVAASPYAGLRIILWRTLSVLAVTVPVAFLTGAVSRIGTPAMWLLPCLGLTGLTLGLGSLIEPARAGLAVAAGWAGLVLVPPGDASPVPPVDNGWLVAPAAVPVWLGVIAAAVALLLARQGRLGGEVAP
ncbi:zf-HC2 domain-containing protein [Plantactinospora sp. ZYX-F-223]|uniref:zf-HC2 domain-containing protein n=1 Tax=Plantactinospora sp. ZYX-F-223 TaxID=3144103 RepID=UPI0031FBDE31